MTSSRAQRFRQAGVAFALQASVWLVLSLVIAAMLLLASPLPLPWGATVWATILNWAPWALLTPLVFWVSRRFPLVSGHLLRSIPVHVFACVACTVAAFWLAAELRAPVSVVRGGFNVATNGPLFGFGARPGPGGPPPDGPHRGPGGPPPEGPYFTTSAVAGAVQVYGGDGVGPVFTQGRRPGSPGLDAQRVVSFNGVTVSTDAPPMPKPRPNWLMPLMPLAMQANFGFGIYLIVASAAHAIGFYRRAREREHQALALMASRDQAKLDALRLQLQPHFLFNTLNAISALIPRRPADANTLVLDLGDLLRASLQTTEHEVTLARELELLDRYLAIEQTRLGDRLRIVRDIPDEVRGAYVPTLILQPLAENAVRHGLEAHIGPGTLTLRARRLGDLLVLSVTDNGVGLPPRGLQLARRGIGLANTEERLRMLHDDRAQFDLRPNRESGVCVEITLPFRTEPAR